MAEHTGPETLYGVVTTYDVYDVQLQLFETPRKRRADLIERLADLIDARDADLDPKDFIFCDENTIIAAILKLLELPEHAITLLAVKRDATGRYDEAPDVYDDRD